MKNYSKTHAKFNLAIKRLSDISPEPLFVCKKRKSLFRFNKTTRECIYRKYYKKDFIRNFFTILPIIIIIILIAGFFISAKTKTTVLAKDVKSIKENFSLDQNDNKKSLLIVNSKKQIPLDYKADLCNFCGIMCDEILINELHNMLDDAKKSGFNLSIIRGYVDKETQKILYDKEVNKLLNSGYSLVRAEAFAEKLLFSPGKCEYETGLLVDINTNNINYESFDSSDEFKWLVNNCVNYGFVLRYPIGKENKTGKNFSPCAFRFVGKDHAKKMRALSMCLEEYISYLNT